MNQDASSMSTISPGYLDEVTGKPSSMRRMALCAFAASVLFAAIHYFNILAVIGMRAQNRLEIDNFTQARFIVLAFLFAAFAPKLVQRFIEGYSPPSFYRSRESWNALGHQSIGGSTLEVGGKRSSVRLMSYLSLAIAIIFGLMFIHNGKNDDGAFQIILIFLSGAFAPKTVHRLIENTQAPSQAHVQSQPPSSGTSPPSQDSNLLTNQLASPGDLMASASDPNPDHQTASQKKRELHTPSRSIIESDLS